ncbi:molybdopterin molybdotransferase MoeA [Rhodanobacter sp. Col0626]|uniref:molybdopterin molybdotransferase MoeA n=1 Tax=Rhodanobacter sp. Col0626 TaxID=3415679 RepID=UPI003CF1E348
MSELLVVAAAEQLIRQQMPLFGSERVSLDKASGRVLRQSIHAERDQPPFDRAMMDGIAISTAGNETRRRFARAGLQLAGMATQSLGDAAGCMEITTGAILPDGCDAVVPIEQTHRDGEYFCLAEGCTPTAGQFVHPRGSDCLAGALLLEPGVRLRATEIGVLAANGMAQVEVASIPSIAIIATGDELAEVDQPLAEGQIRRSNDRALAAALQARGFDDVLLTCVADDLVATTAALGELLQAHQVLVLSGGVSVGQRDYVPDALRALGVRQVLHRIAQRPGKPMWFGIGPQGQAVFALPGNPVSALVCAVRYVLPALLQAIGQHAEPPTPVCLAADTRINPQLTSFVPVQVHHEDDGRTTAQPLAPHTSGDFSALPQTQGFVQLPPGEGFAPAGTVADLYRW